MKDNYDSVFRNLKAPRMTGRYPSYKPVEEPWWYAIIGGAVMGIVLAVMVWLAI